LIIRWAEEKDGHQAGGIHAVHGVSHRKVIKPGRTKEPALI